MDSTWRVPSAWPGFFAWQWVSTELWFRRFIDEGRRAPADRAAASGLPCD